MGKQDKMEKDRQELLDQSADLFERTEIPFARSKREAWKGISSRIQAGRQVRTSQSHRFYGKPGLALAATISLLLSVGTFMRLYQVKTQCPEGERVSLELPDGSRAELNENTLIHVYPLWWPVSRKLRLEGEAFFTVDQGRRFEVSSPQGSTEVLGTSFTIHDRQNEFHVTCHTGSVRVMQHSSKHSVSLAKNERAELTGSGDIEVRKVSVDPHVPAWEGSHMSFTSVPLRDVLDEIEDLFNIHIVSPVDMDYIFTGNLSMDESVDKILSLICWPFNLEYERSSGSEYHVFSPAEN